MYISTKGDISYQSTCHATAVHTSKLRRGQMNSKSEFWMPMKSGFILLPSMLLRFNSFNKLNNLKLKQLKKGHVVRKDILKVKATLRCSHVKK